MKVYSVRNLSFLLSFIIASLRQIDIPANAKWARNGITKGKSYDANISTCTWIEILVLDLF